MPLDKDKDLTVLSETVDTYRIRFNGAEYEVRIFYQGPEIHVIALQGKTEFVRASLNFLEELVRIAKNPPKRLNT